MPHFADLEYSAALHVLQVVPVPQALDTASLKRPRTIAASLAFPACVRRKQDLATIKAEGRLDGDGSSGQCTFSSIIASDVCTPFALLSYASWPVICI